ncbi:MAG: serine hydrolase domain-containing protein [Cyanobacteria bacterium P01_D01_bin.1]
MKSFSPTLFFIGISACLLSLSKPIGPLQAAEQTERQQAQDVNTFLEDTITVATLQNKTDAIDTFVEEMMKEKQIPGLSLAVVYDEKLIKTKSYGWLDLERRIKTRPSSIFPIASMSKPLTATAVMLLVESGKLDLDAPISTYLSDLPEAWRPITLRQMLAHTAGLSEKVYTQKISKLTTPEGFLAEATQEPLDFQPGEAWMYSNTGYNLAAIIVESVSGESFNAFVKAHIFEPLGMTNTDVLRDSYVSSNRAVGYEPTNRGRGVEAIDISYRDLPKIMPMFLGAGSVTSNAVDMARWAIALQKGQLLTPASHVEMQQFSTMNSGRAADYGLGWFLDTINGRDMISHGGNLWGYSSSIMRFPEDKLSIVVLMNKDNEPGDLIAKKIAEQYIPDLLFDRDAPAMPDLAPDLTQKILAFVNGDENAIDRTPEALLALQTPRGQSILDRYRQYRREYTIESLTLIESQTHPNGIRRRYRTTATAGEPHIITAVVTPDSLLSNMTISVPR